MMPVAVSEKYLTAKSKAEQLLKRFRKNEAVVVVPDGLASVLSGDTLLLDHQEIVGQIKSLVGVPDPHWNCFFLQVLEQFALYVQRLPASEAHHHSDMGGLLRHGLEVALNALKERQGILLPPGAEAEELAETNDVWTYATLTSAILHDIGKPLIDQQVTVYDEEGTNLGLWKPFEGPITSQGKYYNTSFRRNREYKTHERIPLLIAHAIIPERGLTWLFSDPALVACWSAMLVGDRDAGSILADLVHSADCLSSASDLTGNEERVRPVGPRQKPLFERLLTGLRYLIDEKLLPINVNGAGGWVVNDELWLVSKRVLDELKEHLNSEGQTGIPGRNDRLMDELQQNGCLIVNADKKAIWKARVSHGDWAKAHDLTLLRLPMSLLWQNTESKPVAFDGNVKPIDAAGLEIESADHTDTEISPAATGACPSTDVVPDQDKNQDSGEGGNASVPVTSLSMPLPPVFSEESEEDVHQVATSNVDTTKTNRPIPDEVDSYSISNAENAGPVEDVESDLGMEFLQWLREGLRKRTMAINSANARVHVVKEGLLLVSPGIFRDFSTTEWYQAQKKFQKLYLNRKTDKRGENIHAYKINGPRKSGKSIRGFLIAEVSQVFPGVKLPPPNEVLSKVTE